MDKWLTNNNVIKLLAILFSIILWAMVHIDSGTAVTTTPIINTKSLDVQIQVVGFDSEEYVLYDLEPSNVRLEVAGTRTNITTNFSDYKVKLNLKDVSPGSYTLPLTHELPPGVQLISIDPGFVKVTIEAKVTTEVPVAIKTKGTIGEGYSLGIPVITKKDKVKVTLPESQVADLGSVVGTVDVTDAQESINGKTVKLTVYDKQGHEMPNAELSIDSVEVDIPIHKVFKHVPIEAKQVGKVPEGYVLSGITFNVKEVDLYGSKEVLEGINSYPVNVDLSRITGEGETKYMVDLTPPEGFEKIEPGSVEVTIQTEQGGKKLVEGIPITLTGTGSDLVSRIVDPADGTISLTVIGREETIRSIAANDVAVAVSVSQLDAGVYSIPIKVTLPNGVKLMESDQLREISVELTDQDKPATTVPEEEQETAEDNQTPHNTAGPDNQSTEEASHGQLNR